MTDDLLTLARAIGAHEAGVSPAASTVWFAAPVGSPVGCAIERGELAEASGSVVSRVMV